MFLYKRMKLISIKEMHLADVLYELPCRTCEFLGAVALSYPPTVRVRATVKLSAAFFRDESSITIEGVRKCNSANFCS